MGPQISAGTECSNTFFQPLMLLTFLTPSTPLWKVQAITDRRTAVTCPIMGDVRMPGAAFASLLHWSMRVFHKATNEISAENRCWFAYSLSILKMMQAQKTSVRQSGANTFLRGFPHCACMMAPCLLWIRGMPSLSLVRVACVRGLCMSSRVCLAYQ